jgi:hypothetical protein
MAMITWKEDADIGGWTGDIGPQWVLEIYPHAKDGWSWTVITDDADQNVPEGWDPTLEDAMVHSERAYFEWRNVVGGRKPAEEHDETAEAEGMESHAEHVDEGEVIRQAATAAKARTRRAGWRWKCPRPLARWACSRAGVCTRPCSARCVGTGVWKKVPLPRRCARRTCRPFWGTMHERGHDPRVWITP